MSAVGLLAALLAWFTVNVTNDALLPRDQAVLAWVSGWSLPGLSGLLSVVSALTGAEAGMAYGLVGVSVLLLLGKTRGASVFTIIAMSIGFVSIMGDYTLGEIVDRSRPEAAAASTAPSFPSGHVFGSMVFFGFMAFLAVYHRLEMKLLVPMLAVLGALIILVGPARVHESSHWPTDVAAGYLLGAIWLLILAPVYIYARSTKFLASRAQTPVQMIEDSEVPRMASSIASLVWLDPKQGTASKIYKPPAVVRIIYWLAFQAKFPYIGNRAALEAAGYRRKVASLIAKHRFGKDMVSPVLAVNDRDGKFEFVTEYVAGKEAENDDTAKELLGQISEAFAEAGLSVWQVNPRNPHAHTNLILTADGDYKIIDLESSLATPFLPKGQRLSAMKAGNFPVFDDVDLPRLHGYVAANSEALTASLGAQGVAELEEAAEGLEASIRSWKGGELRIWGRIASLVYRVFNWKGAYQATARAVEGGEQAAQTFLSAGIDRWSSEGRLAPSEAKELNTYLASPEVGGALRHLGAHMVLTAIFRFPLGSLLRLAWTATFWARIQLAWLRGRKAPVSAGGSNIHNPLVMALSLIPGFGAVAYLAARPLRRKILVRLMLDQTSMKLPFRLYARLHLGRWLAPSVRGTKAGPVKPDAIIGKSSTEWTWLSTEKPELSTSQAGLSTGGHRKNGLFDYENMLPQLTVFVDPAVDLACAVDNRGVVAAAQQTSDLGG
jgi:undecaprenyl-diphosphatase